MGPFLSGSLLIYQIWSVLGAGILYLDLVLFSLLWLYTRWCGAFGLYKVVI